MALLACRQPTDHDSISPYRSCSPEHHDFLQSVSPSRSLGGRGWVVISPRLGPITVTELTEEPVG
jgi:hypothetical protein